MCATRPLEADLRPDVRVTVVLVKPRSTDLFVSEADAKQTPALHPNLGH